MAETTPSSERLARALEERDNPNLAGMIRRTRENFYDDFFSPLIEFAVDRTPREEANAWLNSPEGRAGLRELGDR